MSNVNNRLMRNAEVKQVTGLGQSSLYDLIRKNMFPKQVKLGMRSVAWRESEVLAWMEGLQKAK